MVLKINSVNTQKRKICPACGFENIQGVDVCAECFTDLFHLDASAKPRTNDEFEKAILKDRIFGVETKRALIINSSTPVLEAIRLLVETPKGAVFIVEDLDKSGKIDNPDEIIGIFRATEALKYVFPKDPMPLNEPVKNFMVPNDIILDINSRIADSMHELLIRSIEYLPVYQEGMDLMYFGIKDILDYIMKKNPDLETMQTEGEKKYLKT
jgi:signal-transduction protein with cAMP-binding, CBS, and nucleotidyltransferase domain